MIDKLPKDILSEIVKRDTKSTQKVHRNNTLEIHHIRIHENDWKVLKQYFEGKGIKVSQGIRMIIKEFMESQGI